MTISRTARIEQEDFRLSCLEERLKEIQEEDSKNYTHVREEVSLAHEDRTGPAPDGRPAPEPGVHGGHKTEGTRGRGRETGAQAEPGDPGRLG